MSWLFSQALVAAYSQGHCSDGERFAPLSENLMPQAYLSSDRMTAFSTRSLSGMMFVPLTENLGGALLTWFLGAFPAKTSASPEKARASTGNAPASGKKWTGSLARFCRESFSWRTHQCSLLGGGVRVIADLARMGYVGRYGVMGASAAGSICEGARIWIVAFKADGAMLESMDFSPYFVACEEEPRRRQYTGAVGSMLEQDDYSRVKRDPHAVASQMDRLKAIGNGQDPYLAATAFRILAQNNNIFLSTG